MRNAVVLAVLAYIAAVLAETISTADGLVTFQCPDALTAENAYADETPATLATGEPIDADLVVVDYNSDGDGDRSTGSVFLLGIYAIPNEDDRLCIYSKDLSAATYTEGDDNGPCLLPEGASIPTGGLSRRKAYLPQSKRAVNFPRPQFNCPLEATNAGYQRSLDQTVGRNIYQCNFVDAEGCAYDFSTGERIVPTDDAQAGVCPESLCTSIYTRKRGMENSAITRRQYRPSHNERKQA